MGVQQSKKKLVPNRPPPRKPRSEPHPLRMVPKKPKKMVPPDGGWGWMIVVGACLSLFFLPSVTIAFGVMFTERLEMLGAGATEFTLIANGISVVWSVSALFMAPLSELFGSRPITLTGGLLGFLTFVMVAFSTSVASFALSYSVIGGLACSFTCFFAFVLIPRYFDKRKGLANGLVASTSALGKILMAPLVRLLLDVYGYRWACLIAGALSLHTCISAVLYQPAEWHLIPDPSDEEEKAIQLKARASREVATTESGPVEQDRPLGESGQAAVGAAGAAPVRPLPQEEEEENVIFVMPTTPQTLQPERRDDEAVLFSRIAGTEDTEKKDLKLKICRMDSTLSIAGSIPMLTPVEQAEYSDEGSDKTASCCSECLVVKVFRMLDYSLLREPNFHAVAWPNAILLASYINFMYTLPDYIVSLEYSYYQSAFAISLFSGLEVVCRLAIAFLSDYSWFPIEVIYTTGFVLSALSTGMLTLVPSYNWILACVTIKGVAMSITNVLCIHMIVRYLGADRYAQVIGFFSLLNGIMMIVAGTIAGLLRDWTNGYQATYFWLACNSCAAAAVWVSRVCYKTFESKYKKVPAHTP